MFALLSTELSCRHQLPLKCAENHSLVHMERHASRCKTRSFACRQAHTYTTDTPEHMHKHTASHTPSYVHWGTALLPPAEHTGKHTPAHACAAPTLSWPHAGVPRFTCLLLASLASLPPRATDGKLHLHTPPGYLFYSSPYNSYSLQVSQPIRRKSSSNSGLTDIMV